MDRISHLPDSILHHILSFANTPAHLVRMSVLSKTWFHLTASNPILHFNDHKFTSRDRFFKYVEYATSRFCHHNLTAHKLNLAATIHQPAELDIVNRCLERLLNTGIRKLVIDFTYLSDVPKYRLPNVLLSVSVLQSLSIWGCDLPSSFMLDALKLTSLVYLKIGYVHIDDEVIKYFTIGCPLLRELEINSDFELDEIELCTPSLALFIYSCSEHYNHFGISHLPHLKACMRCYPDHSIDTLWLQQLRLFFDKENGFKAFNLYIHKDQEFILSEKLKAIELPPYELVHIDELHFEDKKSSDHAAFVEAVLCCFRPQSLTLRSSFPLTDFEEQSSLVMFTYERLLEQKQFRGLMLLPKPSPREEKAISFIKEEGTHTSELFL